MTQCPSCSTELPVTSRFCLACGTSIKHAPELNGDATVAMAPGAASPSSPSRMRTSSAAGFAALIEEQRFPPGTLVASRYRIVSRLGKGGMGEVFRADDLILGQPVALKFLPESMSSNVNLLTRFYDEVRIARQITHPNVCRVYDIGEMEGQPYLSMQYIDGEDLGVLLKRIGRLPADKATEITRKLCAGLAAAHAQGVLHRDLKPANIMLDSRGQVMIMDFGLAGIAEHLQGAEVRNGTPAYMAPEQLTGKEVSVRSDIYALGLVLYEMFTGRQAFEASSLAEMIKIREHSGPQSLSTYVHDLEPPVEKAILQCLNPDPRKRPQSALAVAAALPGGDPLAAALAAGETPSPEMVAAAGAVDGMRPKWAVALFASVVAMLAALYVLFPQSQLTPRVPLESPPEVLKQKARDILVNAGYTQKPMDSAQGTYFENDYIDYLLNKKMARSAEAWDKVLALRPTPIEYWYRQSPRTLVSVEAVRSGIVSMEDPPQLISGMASVTLDMAGRLRSFQAVPPQKEDKAEQSPALDWTRFFASAGLDMTQFHPAEPQWTPLFAIDSRTAWTGVYPGHEDLRIRIEAASWHGKPVYFDILGPWVKPQRMQKEEETQKKRIADTITMVIFVAVIAVTAFMVRANARASRGDAKGAWRLGILAFTITMVRWALRTHHVAFSDGEFNLLGEALGDALFEGFLVWGLYMALEPWVRRRWPRTLITWSRALAGRFRDPLVGRDLLLGIAFAMAYILVICAAEYIALHRGTSPPSTNFRASNLMGLRPVLAMYAERANNALQAGTGFFMILFVLRVILRKEWIAGVAFVSIFVLRNSLGSDDFWLAAPLYLIIYSFLVVIMLRFGLFCFTVTVFMLDGTTPMLMTTDLSAWYGLSTAVCLVVVMGLAIYGFRTALGGRKLIDDGLLQG